jgi:U3 small nucleolar RNA-associated protein 7
MIALDADFIGSLAPPTKLTTAIDSKINGKDGKTDTPFARLPRLERLRVQGKADEPDDEDDAMVGGDGEGAEGEEGNDATSRAVKEKNKMRGKGKSIKR